MDLENQGDVLKLSPVSRKDSGIYQCRPLNRDDSSEVKGEMQLTVHCEEPSCVPLPTSRYAKLNTF